MSTSRFGLLDIVVLIVYLAGTTALGIYLGRNQKSANDYFVADRSLPWWAVMFSIVAAETSALTFISIPGLAYMGNFGFLEVCMGYIIGRVVVALVLLPRYFAGNLVTAYALLGTRFGPETRRFTSVVFMVTRAMADSVRVFASAIPIALIIGPSLPKQYVMPAAILVLGALTIVYTYRGGMRAVVWTELLQAGVYVTGGLAAMLLLGRGVDGGWTHILSSAGAAGKLQVLDWYTGIDRAHTVWAGVIGGAFLSMASHGADQTIVQRMLSSRSLRDAQRAIIGSGLVVFVLMTLFLTVGMGLWSFYGAKEFATPDSIFPTYIVTEMPHGLIGLLLASIVAATMSTHSGAINSLAASTTHDLYLPLTKRSADDPSTFKAGRLFALGWGIILTVGALLFPEGKTPVVVIALSIASFTQGALLGAFFLGIYNARANQRDAIAGMTVGIISMAFIVFAKQLTAAYPGMTAALGPFANVAWPWYVLIGLTITFTTGSLLALTHKQQPLPGS